ncbi:hypothetical protein RHS01_04359 [Rhizoctonia solani]|uniref:Uncharacterized protein n=1 Tax=Rhizoctonia solani TaxID=456999 RepID=A0A8H7IIZ4_9AGAM|nr:hypothetical protein RHS01_04359 [Rhizoctonia solani]
MSRPFINEDILIQIVAHLPNTLDRIALGSTARWCYLNIERFVYTHVTLRPDGPAFDVVSRLLKDRALCTHITQLDIMLSTRSRYTTYVPGKDDIQRSFTPGALEFIGTHTELNHLVLTHLTNFPHGSDDLTSLTARFQAPAVDYKLMELGTLWATPWWTRALLTRCDVHTFGLLDKSQSTGAHAQLILDVEIALSISPLVAQGGHKTVRSLALPLDYFVVPRPTLNLELISRAFPVVERVAVTLEPGKEFGSLELLRATESYTAPEALQDPIFESATELCFLLPGEWPHDGSAPHKAISKRGKDVDYAIPYSLVKLMPKLVHVVTPDRCYSRGVKHWGVTSTENVPKVNGPMAMFGSDGQEANASCRNPGYDKY